MGRKERANDKDQRTRRKATASELKAKAATRLRVAEIKRLAAQQAAAAARRQFFADGGGTGSAGSCSAATPGTNDDNDAPSTIDRDDESEVGAQAAGTQGHAAAAEEDHDEGSGDARRRDARPADVEAELDDEADEQAEAGAAAEGVMATYLEVVFGRLHSETIGEASRNSIEQKWLLDILKEEGNNWRLPAARAKSVCRKLGLEYGEPAYYRDILIWLPDERWGAEAMPPCVECESAADVGVHGFQTGHFGRRMCGLQNVCTQYKNVYM